MVRDHASDAAGQHEPMLEILEVPRHEAHAVRIVAVEIRFDEAVGHLPRFAAAAPGGDEHSLDAA